MPLPDEKHRFRPRKRGTPEACDVCGGTYWDPVHHPTLKKPVPG